MKNKNVYKPRYKIAFQTKSKNFINKNCRMRRFFNIRGRKIQRRGYFKRIVLVFNNMKWAVARRYVKPYRKNRRSKRNSYRRVFYTKQQIRKFYGKGKELNFRHFLRSFLLSVKSRNNSFFAALERRLDMVVYRLRFLPTIFACNQLIHHYGICVNNQIEKTPDSLIRIGDSITLAKSHWKPVFLYINRLLIYRAYGFFLSKRRGYRNLKKKLWALKKKRKFRRKNYSLIRKQYKFLSYYKILKTLILDYGYQHLHNLSTYTNKLKIQEKKKDGLFLNKSNSFFKYNKLNYYEISQNYDAFKRRRVLFFAINKTLEKGKIKLWKFLKKGKRKRRLKRKLKWRKNYSFFFKSLTFNYSFTQTFNYLWMCLCLEEFRRLRHILISLFLRQKNNDNPNKIDNNKIQEKNEFLAFQDDDSYVSLIDILWEHEMFLKEKFKYVAISLKASYKYLFKKRLNLKKRKNRRKGIKRLFYFYVKRRYKARRHLLTSRLNSVHWYLPNYFEFNFKTVTGFLMLSPSSKDVYFPFRCTLKKIYSFYRSRGY